MPDNDGNSFSKLVGTEADPIPVGEVSRQKTMDADSNAPMTRPSLRTVISFVSGIILGVVYLNLNWEHNHPRKWADMVGICFVFGALLWLFDRSTRAIIRRIGNCDEK